jgi:hypothetical protein
VSATCVSFVKLAVDSHEASGVDGVEAESAGTAPELVLKAPVYEETFGE